MRAGSSTASFSIRMDRSESSSRAALDARWMSRTASGRMRTFRGAAGAGGLAALVGVRRSAGTSMSWVIEAPASRSSALR